MNLIFDLIIGAIMLSIIISSYKKGFVASVLQLASIVVSGIAAITLYKPVAHFINDNLISNKFTEFIRDKISSLAYDGNIESLVSDMPENFRNFLENFGVSAESIQEGFKTSGLTATKYADSIATDLASTFSYTLSCAISIFGIFIIASIICAVISLIINSVFKLPVLKTANQLLGLIIGIVCSVSVAWVFSHASVLLFDTMGAIYPDTFDRALIDNSFIISFFYQFNPLTLLNKYL